MINEQPVVIHQETAARRNPFAVTNAYNYRDLIFEVSLPSPVIDLLTSLLILFSRRWLPPCGGLRC